MFLYNFYKSSKCVYHLILKKYYLYVYPAVYIVLIILYFFIFLIISYAFIVFSYHYIKIYFVKFLFFYYPFLSLNFPVPTKTCILFDALSAKLHNTNHFVNYSDVTRQILTQNSRIVQNTDIGIIQYWWKFHQESLHSISNTLYDRFWVYNYFLDHLYLSDVHFISYLSPDTNEGYMKTALVDYKINVEQIPIVQLNSWWYFTIQLPGLTLNDLWDQTFDSIMLRERNNPFATSEYIRRIDLIHRRHIFVLDWYTKIYPGDTSFVSKDPVFKQLVAIERQEEGILRNCRRTFYGRSF